MREIDEDAQEYRCIVCEKVVNNHGDCRSNIGSISFGYGSRHDMDKIDVTICDDCKEEKEKKGIIKSVGLSAWGELFCSNGQ